MTTILAKPCHLCGNVLYVWQNCRTGYKSNVWACPHCDRVCRRGARCPDCTQAAKALRPGG